MSQTPTEFIEIITSSDKPIELPKLINSLSAFNKDYRRWLADNGENPNSEECKLYIEKIEKGSIKIWIAKASNTGKSILEFGKDFFTKFVKPNQISKINTTEIQNKHNFINNNKGNKLDISLIKNETIVNNYNFTSEQIEEVGRHTRKLLSKTKTHYSQVEVRFTKFDISSSAKVIIDEIDSDEKIAHLSTNVRSLLLKSEQDNMFKKTYTCDVTVKYMNNSSEVKQYLIEKITHY